MKRPYQNKPRFFNRRYIFIALAVLCIAAIVAGGLFYQARKHHQEVINAKTIPSTKSNPKTDRAITDKNIPSTSQPDSSSNAPIPSSPPTTAATLSSAPSGTFVSNHYPNLSGKPRPSQEQSTCNTVPGASCYIEFISSSGQVKKLTPETADSSGATMWNWDVNTAGFTAGEWQVKAITSLNGVTKTTTDSLKLDVQP